MKPVDRGTTKARQGKVRTRGARQVSEASTAETIVDHGTARNAVMPKGSKIGLLPSALSSLRSRYFATLLAALFASEEPFDDFLKSSPTLLTTCCTAFESVWPYLNITVEMDDVIFNIIRLPIIDMKQSSSLILRATNV